MSHCLEDAELVLGGMRFYGSRWQPEFNDCDIDATTVTDVVVPPHGRRDDDDETW